MTWVSASITATVAGPTYRFEDVYLVPKPWRPKGPTLWFGGQSLSPWIVRRLVAYGDGFHPFGQPSEAEMEPLRAAMAASGRDMAELEIVGGIRPRFPNDFSPGSLDEAAEAVPAQLAVGYTTICFKPSQYTDDIAEVGALCRRLVARVQALAG